MHEAKYSDFHFLDEHNWSPNWYERLLLRLVAVCEKPNHVAAIMDGNRRWSKQHGLDGHLYGLKTFAKVLHWTEAVGIQEITLYAFSKNNFNRTNLEVQDIMDLLFCLFRNVLENRENMKQRGVKFMVYGDIDVLPLKLKNIIAKVILHTQHNQKLKVNLAIAYNATDEIEVLLKSFQDAVISGDLLKDDIDDVFIDRCLYGGENCPDLFIRTGGDMRLSDYLLWQVMYKPLVFLSCLWPDFTFVKYCYAVFMFQRYSKSTAKARSEIVRNTDDAKDMIEEREINKKEMRQEIFLKKRERKYFKFINSIASGPANIK